MANPIIPTSGPLAPGPAPARNPVLAYLGRLAPGSRRTMQAALDALASRLTGADCPGELFPWGQVRYEHTAKLRADLAGSSLAPATVNKHLAALRGVLKEVWRLGLVDAEVYHRASDLPNVRGLTLLAGRGLSTGEVLALFRACPPTVSGARDAALLAVLYGAGLRRSEAVALDVSDLEPESGALTVRQGKGRKARIVYVTNGAQAALRAWLEVRGSEDGAIFCPVRAGRVRLARMTDQAILYILRRIAARAGVPRFSPHDLRRTFIGDLLDAGADLVAVQALAGHASVQTTSRYDRRGERVKREAAAMLHVPYQGVVPPSDGAAQSAN